MNKACSKRIKIKKGKIMLHIILIIVGIILLISFVYHILHILAGIALIALICAGIYYYFSFFTITFPVTIILILTYIIYVQIRKRLNKSWILNNYRPCTEIDVEDLLYPFIEKLVSIDTNNKDYIFTKNNLPYGRINSFLCYFNKSIYTDEPLFFSCITSHSIQELREYGLIITCSGIYISTQEYDKEKEKTVVKNQFINFCGLRRATVITEKKRKKIDIINVSIDTYADKRTTITLPYNLSSDDACNVICDLCNKVIQDKIGPSIYIQTSLYAFSESGETKVAKDIKNTLNSLDSMKNVSNTLNAFATVQLSKNRAKTYDEIGNQMHGHQGHGYAAEYANNTIDKILLKDVKYVGQMRDEHGRQIKNGADRIVNNVEIQSKYCQTPTDCINSIFKNGKARYICADGSGKMMKIEVPRGMGKECAEILQKKIDNGQVPNVKPGETAKDYIIEGKISYEQAKNIAKAGTIESIKYDALNGVIQSIDTASLCAVLTYVSMLANGEDASEASYTALKTFGKTVRSNTLINTVAMQIDRKDINIIGKKITKQNAAFAMQVIITIGPDLFNTLSKNISVDQCIKNVAISGGAIAGSVIGSELIPIPILGGMIGGAVGNFVVKNIADTFIEDDVIKMFRILKEEYLDVVMDSGLNQREIQQVTDYTLKNEQLTTILQDMFRSGEARAYAREAIIEPTVITVLSYRSQITHDMLVRGMHGV